MSPAARGCTVPKSSLPCACCSANDSPGVLSNGMPVSAGAVGAVGEVNVNAGVASADGVAEAPAAFALSSSAAVISARCWVALRGPVNAPIPPPMMLPTIKPRTADCATPLVMSLPVNAFWIAVSAPDCIVSSAPSLATPPRIDLTTVCPASVAGF